MDLDSKVSVIMGIYNCELTLKEAIDSIVNQTYKNWELIMCDDCSKDKTYEIALEYQKKYPDKIKVLKNDRNITLGPTLNRCLEVATGKYIARQDGDDISVENRFEEQIKFLKNNKNYDLVGTAMISFDKNGEKGIRGVAIQIPTKDILAKQVPFAHATIMAKKQVYEKLKGYRSEKYTYRCEDIDLWFRFFKQGFKGCNIEKALYKVRDDGSEYERRALKVYLNVFLTNLNGYRLLNIPKKDYIYLIKPLIVMLVPKFLIKYYHKNRLK